MAQVSYGTITITDTNDIESIIVEYNRNQSTTTPPAENDSGWSTTRPTWAQGYYIWQRTRIHKTGTQDSADTFGTAVCLTGSTGQTGATGKGITGVETLYATNNSTTTAPTSGWQSQPPTYNSSKPKYWVKVTTTYNSGDPTVVTYLDNGITDAMATAAAANQTANNAKNKVDSLETTYNTFINTEAKYFVHNSSGSIVIASREGESSPVTFDKNTVSTYGYNALTAPSYIALRYNSVELAKLSTGALTFYKPNTTNKGMELTSTALTFYNPSNNNAQLIIGANGILQSGNYIAPTITENDIEGTSPYSVTGSKFDLTYGSIITPNFVLDNDNGNAYFKGNITANSLTIEENANISGLIYAINSSGDVDSDGEVLIDAGKVNIEGASIFTGDGRLSVDSMNVLEDKISSKRSTYTLITNVSDTYSNLSESATEGKLANWTVQYTPDIINIAPGDTVRLQCNVSDMNAPAYIIGTVLEVNADGNTVRVESHGLESTIIYGGNILTNSISVQNIDMNSLQTAIARIGDSNSFHIEIDGEELGFYNNQTKLAYLRNNQLFINQSVAVKQTNVGLPIGMEDPTTHELGRGQWSWKVHANASGQNNLYLKWMG